MSPDRAADREVIELFAYETEGQLRSLENILSDADGAKAFSDEQVRELFRIMHTLKGSSAMLGCGAFSKTAHMLEDIFSMIRSGAAVLDEIAFKGVSDLLFSAMGYFRDFAEALSDGQTIPTPAQLDERIAALTASLKAEESGGGKVAAANNGLCRVEWMNSASSVLVLLKKTPVPCLRALVAVNCARKLCSEIISVPPQIEKHGELADDIAKNGFHILFVPKDGTTPEDVAALINDNVHVESCALEDRNAKAKKPEAKPQSENGEHAAADKVVSVRKSRLDEHIDLLGELLTSESMLAEAIGTLNIMDDSVQRLLAQLDKVARALHKSASAMDMAVMDGIFFRLRLLVREMAGKLGKDIDFVCAGGGTEAERDMLDHLYDPLLHMVRNAVDHGIESEDERVRAGKPKRGSVRLETSRYKEDYLRITLSDDGCGIDTDKIAAKAAELGIIRDGGEQKSDSELYELLLRPGFTLSSGVSEYSGRGVGLDVVNTSLRKLGGSMSIKSERGAGTVFTITIPASASMVEAIEITAGGSRAVLPLSMVRLVVTRDNIGAIDGISEDGTRLSAGGREYQVINLAKRLGCAGGRGVYILLDRQDVDAAISADEVLQLRTIVKKRLPQYMSAMKHLTKAYSGCTILGDGSVCMVLDTDKLTIE